MQIDWLTVTAQIINFLVLAWLLKRFLYGPVTEAMDRREARIAKRLDEATEREKEAHVEARGYREKVAEIERNREAQLAQAREVAERERHALVEAARDEARASRERWQQDLERERADFHQALVRELAEAAIAVARRTLADLADARLEAQAIATLARQVPALAAEERQALADAGPRLKLASTFEPDTEALAQLRQVLTDALGQPIELDCVRKPALVLGVELTGAGHKLAWSVSGYLDEIAEQVRASLEDAHQATHEAARGAPRDAAPAAT